MNRSEQFELFHRYFDSENTRYESLTSRASIYLSVISGLALFAGLNLEDISGFISRNPITLLLSGCSGLFVLFSLAAIVLSLRVYPYKDICDIEEIVVAIDENNYEKEDVYSVLLANLAVATKNNSSINDHRARCLQWAVAFLGLAVTFFIVTNMVVVVTFNGRQI